MGNPKSAAQLAKLLEYILGRRPDEFGLVLDADGWIPVRDLLQAVAEEEGFRHVRQASITEILLTVPRPPVETDGRRIRAVQRGHLHEGACTQDPPKLLYTGVTRKSYPVVLEKGIFPTRHARVILATDPIMAQRMAGRREPSPVILTVHVQQAMEKGAVFHSEGETLFTTDRIAPGCFSGPPLPKPKPEAAPKKKPDEEAEKRKTPGSFLLDIMKDPAAKKERGKEKAGSWKRDKKRIRRDKQKYWPE
ncbi:MAG: RNA 2'-phosphotransferase [Thermodesulfobacteriota bacterium]